MKKIILGLMAIVINMSLFSCTKDDVVSEKIVNQQSENEKCCGDSGDIPPPPPEGD